MNFFLCDPIDKIGQLQYVGAVDGLRGRKAN